MERPFTFTNYLFSWRGLYLHTLPIFTNKTLIMIVCVSQNSGWGAHRSWKFVSLVPPVWPRNRFRLLKEEKTYHQKRRRGGNNLSMVSYLVALDPTFSFPLLFGRFSVCLSIVHWGTMFGSRRTLLARHNDLQDTLKEEIYARIRAAWSYFGKKGNLSW